MKGLVTCVAYAGGRRIGEVSIPDISEVLKLPDRFVWLGLVEPDEEMLAEIQLERYGDSLFVVLRTAHLDPTTGGIDYGETHLFVGPNYIVSIRHGRSLPYTDVRTRCEASPDLLAKGPGFVLYALMDFIVDQYFPLVDAFEDKLGALEDNIFSQTLTRETTEQIYQLKRELLEVKRAVAPLVDMGNRLVRADLTLIPDAARVYFRDVYDRAIRINEMIDTIRELLTTALEANLSLISVSQNEAMKRLAAWARPSSRSRR